MSRRYPCRMRQSPCVLRSAAILGVCLLPFAAGVSAPTDPAASAPAATAPAAAAPVSGDAAAKHAKRTACLKDARAKKLVGADKTAFLKSCIAAP
jgi:hypothetical protein